MNVIAFALLALMLVTYAVLDGYDLGIGAILYLFGRTNEMRGRAIASIGPFWNGNEVWLIASGAVLFAFFPRAYAVSFSGFYLPFMMVLWLLMFRGIGLELRAHNQSRLWQDFWDVTFSVASTLLALLFGVALGNLIKGLPLDASGNFIGSFSVLLNPYSLLVGVFTVVILAHHGWRFLGMALPLNVVSKRVSFILWSLSIAGFIVVTALTLAIHHIDGVKLILASVLGAASLISLIAAELLARRGARKGAFAASCASIAALLGAATTTLFPYLIASSTAKSGITIYDSTSNGQALGVIIPIVVVGLISVYVYLTIVTRKLIR